MTLAVLPTIFVDGQVLAAADLNGDFSALNTAVVTFADGGTGLIAAPLNGQIPIGNNSLGYALATLTAGAGTTITNGPGSITIAKAANAVVTTLTTGDVSTGSAVFGFVGGLSVAITLPAGTSGKVHVVATIGYFNDTGGGGAEFDIRQDVGPAFLFGDGQTSLQQVSSIANGGQIMTLSTVVTGLAAGVVTFAVLFRSIGGGTLTVKGQAGRHSAISAVEI